MSQSPRSNAGFFVLHKYEMLPFSAFLSEGTLTQMTSAFKQKFSEEYPPNYVESLLNDFLVLSKRFPKNKGADIGYWIAQDNLNEMDDWVTEMQSKLEDRTPKTSAVFQNDNISIRQADNYAGARKLGRAVCGGDSPWCISVDKPMWTHIPTSRKSNFMFCKLKNGKKFSDGSDYCLLQVRRFRHGVSPNIFVWNYNNRVDDSLLDELREYGVPVDFL